MRKYLFSLLLHGWDLEKNEKCPSTAVFYTIWGRSSIKSGTRRDIIIIVQIIRIWCIFFIHNDKTNIRYDFWILQKHILDYNQNILVFQLFAIQNMHHFAKLLYVYNFNKTSSQYFIIYIWINTNNVYYVVNYVFEEFQP